MKEDPSYRATSVSIESISEALPKLEPLTDVGAESYDLGIFALGFEERAISAAKGLIENGSSLDSAVVLVYETNEEQNEQNWKELSEVLAEMAPNGRIARVDQQAFSTTELRNVLHAGGVRKVLFDITVASNPLILRVLSTIFDFDVELTVLYAEADSYFPTREQFEAAGENISSLELASGTGRLESAVEWPGDMDEASRDCLIVIPGFDHDRSRKTISFVDPALFSTGQSQVIWMVGKPHLEEDSWRADLMMTIHGVGSESDWPEFRMASTFDYVEVWRELEAIYQDRCDTHRFTLAPMGSKLSAFGCALFGMSRTDVRMVFASPSEYVADRYSTGVRAVWALRAGSVAELKLAIRSVGELRIMNSSGDLIFEGTRRVDWET